MFISDNISWLYLILGIFSSALVSLSSSKLKLIEKKSELLYLSFGFYRHFFAIFISNFFSSILLILKIAFRFKTSHPLIYKAKISADDHFNPALLETHFNMTSGLFCIDLTDSEATIHALDKSYYNKFDLNRVKKSLNSVNDDNLI